MARVYLSTLAAIGLLGFGAWYVFSSSLSAQPESFILRVAPSASSMKLTSSAFASGSDIPMKYTCEGEGISPPLTIKDVPEGTQSLAIIMHDPDVPKALKADGVFDHWVLFNVIPTTTEIAENEAPGIEGKNGAGKIGFMGSCPPKEYQPSKHRYFFTLYALKSELPLPQGVSKAEVLEAMEGQVISKAELVGTYEKQK